MQAGREHFDEHFSRSFGRGIGEVAVARRLVERGDDSSFHGFSFERHVVYKVRNTNLY